MFLSWNGATRTTRSPVYMYYFLFQELSMVWRTFARCSGMSIAYLLWLQVRLCGHFLGPQAHHVLIGEHVPEAVGAHHEGVLSAQLGRGQIDYLNLSKSQEKSKSALTRGQWFYRSAATRAKMPYISYANLVNLSLEKMAFMPLFTKCLHPPHPSPKPCQDQCIYGGMTQKKKVK